MAISKIIYKSSAEDTGTVWMDVTQKTVTASTMLNGTTALKNDGTDITGNIASKTSSDLTASTLTVTAPAGYYASNATKTLTDENLIAGNIKKDIQIFGVTGSYEGGGGSTTWETKINQTLTSWTLDTDAAAYFCEVTGFTETIDYNSVWRVTWNGVEYTCTATSAGVEESFAQPYAIGNGTIVGLQDGDNEPFWMQIFFGHLFIYQAQSQSVTFKLEKQVSGGGSTGLEYETGTWTPTEDVASATISFSNTHTAMPAVVIMAEASDSSSSWTNYSLFEWNYINTGDLFGGGYPRSDSDFGYGRVDVIRKSNTSSLNVTNTTSLLFPSSETSDTTAVYPRYWVTASSFKAYATNNSYYWRSGRTYKWIAVWAPST